MWITTLFVHYIRTVRIDSTPFPNPHLVCGFGDFGNLELLYMSSENVSFIWTAPVASNPVVNYQALIYQLIRSNPPGAQVETIKMNHCTYPTNFVQRIQIVLIKLQWNSKYLVLRVVQAKLQWMKEWMSEWFLIAVYHKSLH